MAINRVKVWGAEVLEASDLNAEFNNILDNALSLISPLTANLDFGGFKLTNLAGGSVSAPALYFTGDSNTGIYNSAADVLDITAGGVRAASFITATTGVNYFKFTPSATTAAISLDADGSDTDIGINFDTKGTGAHIFRRAGGSTEDGRMSSGTLLWGTTVTTGVNAGEIVFANTKGIRFLTSGGSPDGTNFAIVSTSAEDIDFRVPGADSFNFVFAGTRQARIIQLNSAPYINLEAEASADSSTPGANGCYIFLLDNGAGKTQLMAKFNTGATQVMATQP